MYSFFLCTGWAKSRYTVIISSCTGIVKDGRERMYRTKKVGFEAVLENRKMPSGYAQHG